jgi:NAD-dependent DNA ligase
MIKELVDKITTARELYEQGEDTGYTDAEYDALELQLRRLDPTNQILKQVGSPVRGGKVPLPYPMNGIEQIYSEQFQKWITPYNNDIIVVTDKLDGLSVLLMYDNGQFVAAYSRGNGTEGADVSRHILQFKNKIPKSIPMLNKIFIRAEIILEEKSFEIINDKYNKFANARNFTAGQMNREVSIDEFYQYVKVISYTIYNTNLSKIKQLAQLQDYGFDTPQYFICKGATLNEHKLAQHLDDRRNNSPFQLDGLVITNDEKPDIQIKFKIGAQDNKATTEVIDVEWNVSKDGYLNPVVIIQPVSLAGVTISRATAFNAKYIVDNGIGPGAIISIIRSGDVIPFITEVIVKVKPLLPEYDYIWTETGVDIIINEQHSDIVVQQMIHCFKTLEVFGAGEGQLKKMLYQGEHPLYAQEKTWIDIIGVNGGKIYKSLQEKLSSSSLEKIADALGCFGRGIGERKLEFCSNAGVNFTNATLEQLISVPGIETKTASRIIDGQELFIEKINSLNLQDKLNNHLTKPKQIGTRFADVVWQFTGVRDKDLEVAFEAEGGKIGSKFTVLIAKDPTSNSTKMKAARDKGAEIISLFEARKRVFE